MSAITIGIDNGVSGGLVALGQCGSFIEGIQMPTMIRKHTWERYCKRIRNGVTFTLSEQAMENQIDAHSMITWIKNVTDSIACAIVIEECPEHADQSSIMRSMAMSYGILIGSITACLPDYELHVVRSGNPKDSWQRAMLGKVPAGETKQAALRLAKKLWPDENFRATPRSKTPHTGIVDAALIAQYAINKGK